MPYINIETRLKRTWVERLFSWPWRPWQSHIVTVRREYRASYIAPNAETMAKIDRIIAERKAWKEKNLAAKKESERVVAGRMLHEQLDSMRRSNDLEDLVTAQQFMQTNAVEVYHTSDSTPAPEPITSGQGGDFGGGGASSSWSSDSCDTPSSSSSDSGSCDSSSSSSD